MRGHIRKRGNAWAVVVDIGRDESGRRRQKWHSGYRTKREASEALTEILGQLSTGQYVAPSKLTVRQFLEDEWIPSIRASLRPLTLESYTANVRNHVLPRLGGVLLQRLTPAMLNAMYAELGERLSLRTVRYIHAIVRRALADAVRWNRLTQSPADLANPPSLKAARKRVMETWSARELRVFLEAVSEDRLAACWRFLAMTGCRRGEALGLRWRDVDLDDGRAMIVQALVGKRAISEPKSERGRRTIALDRDTVAALRSHREAQLDERRAFESAYEDNDLVFCREDGTPIWPRSLSRSFERHVSAAGLPRIRLHDLRHTHATLALQAGVHPKVVQEHLGHSTISITLDVYSHAIPAMQEEAASHVAALLKP
ncbi:MAG: site-specific integrase [Actinomycetota bacterium]|nr:site-specific integrase [Actinomycetota bacterium]